MSTRVAADLLLAHAGTIALLNTTRRVDSNRLVKTLRSDGSTFIRFGAEVSGQLGMADDRHGEIPHHSVSRHLRYCFS